RTAKSGDCSIMKGGHRNFSWNKIKRDRAHAAQGGICSYCTLPMSRTEATLEHKVPRSKGGTDAADNLIAVHEWCNATKGNASPKAFKKLSDGDGLTGIFPIALLRTLRRIDPNTQRACKRIRRATA